jgi:hypothetical protein
LPRTSQEFAREWRRHCHTPADKYRSAHALLSLDVIQLATLCMDPAASILLLHSVRRHMSINQSILHL